MNHSFDASAVPYTLVETRGLSTAINTSSLLTASQSHSIQVVSCVLSAISLTATLVTFVWFLRMTRKFRHNLIFILITADVSRSLWLLVFCVVTFISGQPATASNLCQITGFFYQSALCLADLAVLTIAIHTALQIFRPTIGRVGNRPDESGLYRFRHWIYVIGATVPFAVASLAFVDGVPGYRSQGPYCSLPVRPFWFRLGLSWIPRYAILLTILGLYIAIYIHVALQFRTISWLRKLPGTSHAPAPLNKQAPVNVDGTDKTNLRRLSTLNLFSLRPGSRPSTPGGSFQGPTRTSRVSSSGTTLIGSAAGVNAEKAAELDRQEQNTIGPVRDMSVGSTQANLDGPSDFITSAIGVPGAQTPRRGHSDANSTDTATEPQEKAALEQAQSLKEIRKRHAAVQHKVRTLFIYPMVYFIMWVIPFVNHAFTYSNYWAQHPMFPLVLLNFMCISMMGTIDCLIFSLRERPWTAIADSDGSILGSFLFWRKAPSRRPSSGSKLSADEAGDTPSDTGAYGSPKRRLGSIAEGDVENDAAYSPTAFAPPVAQSGPRQGSHESPGGPFDTWEFGAKGYDGVISNAPVTPKQERNWFDRRLSAAVGQSVQPRMR